MSRDWTPYEMYLVEADNLKRGRESYFDFMRSLTVSFNGKTWPFNSEEKVVLCEQYPVLGKLLSDELCALHESLSKFDGGLDLLRQKDDALADFIASGQGDRNSNLIKWFYGELDTNFYYRERNDELLIESILEEAKALNKHPSLDYQINIASEKAVKEASAQSLQKEAER